MAPGFESVGTNRLRGLISGQVIPYGGDRFVTVSDELARIFREGDRLVVVQETGDLLHVPEDVAKLVHDRVTAAIGGFNALAGVDAESLTAFFEGFARRIEDDAVFPAIASANAADVRRASEAGRSTSRLHMTPAMRKDMVGALRMWRDLPDGRDTVTEVVEHGTWSVEARRAPTGVVGFVFEGRPNVFADATGVLRSGNSVVFRIGSDALDTARALMDVALRPALRESGLPEGCVQLVDSAERSAGYALFADRRLSLAVARGSGPAVAQLGAVARQAGVPVSLHGTGGAWLVVDRGVDTDRVSGVVECSLDRKVCNTANVICVPDDQTLMTAVVDGVVAAARSRDRIPRVHAVGPDARRLVESAGRPVDLVGESDPTVLAVEWEWDEVPEVSIVVVDSIGHAVDLFNRHSPRFVISVLSENADAAEIVYRSAEAPFVGDGFTRWVDGQYALERPELGLSNWQYGRMLARGGILSGDSVFTIRYVSRHRDPRQRR